MLNFEKHYLDQDIQGSWSFQNIGTKLNFHIDAVRLGGIINPYFAQTD